MRSFVTTIFSVFLIFSFCVAPVGATPSVATSPVPVKPSEATGVKSVPLILQPRAKIAAPTPVKPAQQFDFSTISAKSVLVIDVNSRRVLLEKNASEQWPIASITKLMTILVVLDKKIPLTRVGSIQKQDEVGGARLRVASGSRVTIKDLLYATLVGSANNAANAIARSTGLSRKSFVSAMNKKAKSIGLTQTTFVDTSGISPQNVATAYDTAALAITAFSHKTIRAAVQTPQYTVRATEPTVVKKKIRWKTVLHPIKSTDALLVDETNGLWVIGGKTGYLTESQWNFVTEIRDTKNKPLLVVVFGSPTKDQVFSDTETLVKWVWGNYTW